LLCGNNDNDDDDDDDDGGDGGGVGGDNILFNHFTLEGACPDKPNKFKILYLVPISISILNFLRRLSRLSQESVPGCFKE